MHKILEDIQEFLEGEESFFFTFAQDMVDPQFTDEIPTAAVFFQQESESKKILGFRFNEGFWNSLDYTEKCFLFAHETLHVLLAHGIRGKRFLESLNEKDRNNDFLNKAMDVCINEMLLEQYFAPLKFEEMPVLSIGCTIKSVFTRNGIAVESGKSFEYYYNKMLQNPDKFGEADMSFDIHDFLNFPGLADSKILQKLADILEGKDGEKLGEILADNTELSNLIKTRGYSISSINSFKNVILTKGSTSEKLEKHIDFVMRTSLKVEHAKLKTSWISSSRRMIAMPKVMNLPSRLLRKDFAKHKILIYCDVSGSCESISNKFVKLITELNRDKYELDVYVFADRVKLAKVVANGSMTYSGAGGGTNIQDVIYHYNEAEDENYDGVFVLTDGYYANIRHRVESKYKKWTFFMTTGEQNAPQESRIIQLSL